MSEAAAIPEIVPIDLTADVDRGQELTRLIDLYTAERKQIEARIVAAALAQPELHEPLEDAERDGRQFFAQGTTDKVPVLLTADQIVASFQKDSAVHRKIADATPKFFARFFKPVTGFKVFAKDGKKFRALARELLGDEAPAFIRACYARDKFGVPKNQIKVVWSRASADPAEADVEGEEEA